MGSTFAIIGFTIWPNLSKMQSLNHTIKSRPKVLYMYISRPKYMYMYIFRMTGLISTP